MTRRLLLSYLSLTLFVLLLLELPLAVFFQQRETDRLTADIERDATVLATLFEDALEGGTALDPTPAREYSARTDARIVVVDVAGISLLDTDVPADVAGESRRDFSTRPEFELALAGERATGTRYSSTLGGDLVFVAVPVASGGRVHGALRVTFDTAEVRSRVVTFWLGLVAVGGLILVVVAAFGWALSRSITRPIRNLQQTAARFSHGDLRHSEPDEGAPAELADLERSLNTMATRLQRLLEQQRAFVADASHQLRTPLTALQLRLENLRSDAADSGTQREIDATIEETERLANLVSDLLQMASAERVAEVGACDLARLTAERVETWSAVAEQAGVTLHADATSDGAVWVESVVGGIEQMLDNLLDNAIEASPAGAVVDVRVERGETSHRLRVIDRGAGLSPTERSQATERFWRADSTRPGSGLGLAIVRSLAEMSGGSIELVTTEPTGITAIVSLPAAAVPAAH